MIIVYRRIIPKIDDKVNPQLCYLLNYHGKIVKVKKIDNIEDKNFKLKDKKLRWTKVNKCPHCENNSFYSIFEKKNNRYFICDICTYEEVDYF